MYNIKNIPFSSSNIQMKLETSFSLKKYLIPAALSVGTQSRGSFFHCHQRSSPELYPEGPPRLSLACRVLPDLQM